ncbi:MAG: redoxin domain-containing protein [Acidobacteriota bacterium]|nr:redoxin domain-containing protein [Acidobacteriota bacterium]
MNHRKTDILITALIIWLLFIAISNSFLFGFQSVGQPFPGTTAKIYHSLEEAAGTSSWPVLLVFFSLDCFTCWDELFEMKEFIEKFSLSVQLIGVSTDKKEELEAFASRYSFNYPIIQDEDKYLYRQYKVRHEPYRVVLDKNQAVYIDDDRHDYSLRREKTKHFLLSLTSR